MGLRREQQISQDDDPTSGLLSSLSPASAYADDPPDYIDSSDDFAIDANDITPIQSRTVIAAKLLVLISGALWLAFVVWLLIRRGFIVPSPEQIPLAAAGLCTPLVLLGLIYLIITRSSVSESGRFARITTKLQRETTAFDTRLATVNQQLDIAYATLKEQASLLEQYGGSASLNLEEAAKTMAQHAGKAAEQTEIIERVGMTLGHQFSQIIETMPTIEERATRLSAALAEGSDSLTERVDRLEARLDSLTRLLDEARTRTTTATQSLTAQLMRIQDATRSASEEMTGMADVSAHRLEAAVDQVRRTMEETGTGLETRAADLNTLVAQARSALDDIGGEAVRTYGENISRIEAKLLDLGQLVQTQSSTISTIGEEMGLKIAALGDQFSALEMLSLGGSERMSTAFAELTNRTEQLDEALQSGNRTAETMIARAESLLVALDASVRELDESHPAALARLTDKIDSTQRLLGIIMPEIERLENISITVLTRTRESEELLSGQGHRLKGLLDSGGASFATCRDQITELQQAMDTADSNARRLADSAGPQLVATLLRVKETAEQAGERARQALSRAITDATSELGEATEQVLSQSLGEHFKARVEELNTVAERAVKSAHTASERLMRQLITIADTTASVEQRFAEADEIAQRRDQDNFSRQSAVLIESLNSIAIDVARLLSEEVTDSSWAAYLEGDRGIFSRRAVRLLNGDEARSILQLYQDDDAFRDTVNRYVHDFEAMLRTVLATRDGTSLAVTLLSSDIGKLYVALAQAIERLKDI